MAENKDTAPMAEIDDSSDAIGVAEDSVRESTVGWIGPVGHFPIENRIKIAHKMGIILALLFWVA